MSDLIGQTLDHYRIDRLLGQGTLGTVYRAQDLQSDEPAALKIIHANYAVQASFRNQFQRDMQLMIPFRHPNLAEVYATGYTNDLLYVVTEYLEGDSLRQYIQRTIGNKQFPHLDTVIAYSAQIANGLHYAHDQGILHLNIKPTNILMKDLNDDEKQLIITDLGMQQLVRGGFNSEVSAPVGALPYIAPEIASGGTGDVEADVYALGVILYELASGKLPFVPRTLADAVRMHTQTPVPLPSYFRPGLPRLLEEMILQCLEKDPSNRFQSAGELARALENLRIRLEHVYTTQYNLDDDLAYSTMVAYETIPNIQEIPTEPRVETEQIGYDRLVISGSGIPTRAIAFDKPSYVIGRDPNADITLDSDHISRYHVRIQKSNGTYYVMDLGSMNGIWLGNDPVPLPANTLREWHSGTKLRLGEFTVLLESADSVYQPLPPMESVIVDEVEEIPQEQFVTEEQVPLDISVTLTPRKVIVVPGENQAMQLTLNNLSGRVDHFTISLRNTNIKDDWVDLPGTAIEMLQDTSQSVPINFRPPRDSQSLAGLYSFEVVIESRGQRNTYPAVVYGQVQIEPFYNFSIDLHPKRLRGGRKQPHLLIRNEGNTRQLYNITARDPEEELNIYVSVPAPSIAPGGEQDVQLNVNSKRRAIFGTTNSYPFEVIVSDPQALVESQTENGTLTVPPYLSNQVMTLGLLLLASLGLLGFCTVSRIVSNIEIAAQRRAATQEAQNILATQASMTATAESDVDNDGLTLIEETNLGTDPEQADTDFDGLSDFEEATFFGTDPTKLDTDGDSVADGAEVNILRTSPNNPDSDGDGIQDNVDPDPLQQPTPLPPTPAPFVTPAG